MIGPFRGRWSKLGNYSPCLVFMDGHAYNSVEHAYQAAKSVDDGVRKTIRDQPTPAEAKRIARRISLRPDWESVKLDVMLSLLREKFASEPERSILLSTGGEMLVEVNWWGDRFWGMVDGVGENNLGKLLMQVRCELAMEVLDGQN